MKTTILYNTTVPILDVRTWAEQYTAESMMMHTHLSLVGVGCARMPNSIAVLDRTDLGRFFVITDSERDEDLVKDYVESEFELRDKKALAIRIPQVTYAKFREDLEHVMAGRYTKLSNEYVLQIEKCNPAIRLVDGKFKYNMRVMLLRREPEMYKYANLLISQLYDGDYEDVPNTEEIIPAPHPSHFIDHYL
jgi:hypothetical protein